MAVATPEKKPGKTGPSPGIKLLLPQTIQKMRQALPKFPVRRSAILPALHAAYDQLGYLNDEIYAEISQVIGVPALEIAEAATFYTLFPKKKVGKYLIMVCTNISCALCGADSLVSYLEQKLGIKNGETTPDGLFTLWTVECLGSCGTAPMLQVNEAFYENLTREKVDRLLEAWQQGKPVEVKIMERGW